MIFGRQMWILTMDYNVLCNILLWLFDDDFWNCMHLCCVAASICVFLENTDLVCLVERNVVEACSIDVMLCGCFDVCPPRKYRSYLFG